MSDPQSNVAPMTAKLKMSQAILSGLIFARRRINGQNGTIWLTVIRLPSQDEFSNPATVEVRSHSPLGEINDKWSGVITIGGFGRSYNTKPDPETGEIKSVKTAQVTLDVIEA